MEWTLASRRVGGLVPDITGTNEPKHVECGAPDFLVTHKTSYIEAKDFSASLDEAERSEQLKRYLPTTA